MQTTIYIDGTHCHSCKALIEDICMELQGVISCTVNFATGETSIEHDESIDWNLLKKEIESLGDYTVQLSRV